MIVSQTLGVGRRLARCAPVLCITALSDPQSAIAGDFHGHHGSECIATDNVEADWNRSEHRITRSGAAGSGNLFCPVVRDSFTDDCWWGFELLALCAPEVVIARVQVQDSHGGGDVSCTLRARDMTGAAIDFDTQVTSGTPGTQELGMLVLWAPDEGTYLLTCSMPSNGPQGFAKLFGYVIEEHEAE
jgi:hypothetical protein